MNRTSDNHLPTGVPSTPKAFSSAGETRLSLFSKELRRPQLPESAAPKVQEVYYVQLHMKDAQPNPRIVEQITGPTFENVKTPQTSSLCARGTGTASCGIHANTDNDCNQHIDAQTPILCTAASRNVRGNSI